MVRTALRTLALTALVAAALPVAAQVAVTDSSVGANAKGTYINPNVATVEATDANGMPLTAFVKVIQGDAPDGVHMLTTLFAVQGHSGASMDTVLVPNRAACIEAGAGQLRVLLLSKPYPENQFIEQGNDSMNANLLDVGDFTQWVGVTCQPLSYAQ